MAIIVQKSMAKKYRPVISDEHMDFMEEYKKATGISVLKFVTDAIQEKINRVNLQIEVDNIEYIKKQ